MRFDVKRLDPRRLFGSREASLSDRVVVPRGRVSSEEPTTLQELLSIGQKVVGFVNPKIPYAFLDIIEKMCLINPDFSQALNNLVTLGNSGHELSVAAQSDRTIEAALARLNELAARINTDDLVNRYLRQLGVTGAVSTEWVADGSLSGIERVVLVPTASIRFQYDRRKDVYLPYQYVSTKGKYIELNPVTYTYVASEQAEGSPYAIPPYLAALGSAVVQMYMTDSLKFVAQKLGLLGFISVKIARPPREPGEQESAYRERLQSYLDEYAEYMGKNYRDGLAIAFKDIEIDHSNIASESRGARDFFQVNEEQVFSGLKTIAALHGRTYSTTETYAGVVYNMFVNQLGSYRRIVKRVIEKGYKLDLMLGGIPVDDVSLTFNADSAFRPKEEAEAEKIRIEGVIAKMDAGIIGPDDAARELGYEQAYLGEYAVDEGGLSLARSVPSVRLSFDGSRYRLVAPRIAVGPAVVGGSTDLKRDIDSGESAIENRRLRWVSYYLNNVKVIDAGARRRLLEELADKMKRGLIIAVTPEYFADQVYGFLVTTYPELLKAQGLREAVDGSVLAAYRFYRTRDKLVRKGRIPVRFTLPDKRAVRFLQGLEDFHVSKYVTNEPVKKSMLKFLRDEYLEGGHTDVDAFTRRFGGKLTGLSRSQLQRIADTGVSRIRNWGHVRQLAESRIRTAEVSEVMDRITCAICREMDGKTFRVKVADQRVQELSVLSAEQFKERVYDNAPDDWKADPVGYARSRSGEEMIADDIVGPPYHPSCRGRLIVK